MNVFIVKKRFFFCLLLISGVLSGCDSEKKKGPVAVLQQPASNAAYPVGKQVPVRFALKESDVAVDSVRCLLNGKRISALQYEAPGSYTFDTKGYGLGAHELSIHIYYKDDPPDEYQGNIILLADTAPALLSYQVIQTFPHDTADFTQGLFYEDGIMYEGTGLTGRSKLKKYELRTGKVLKEVKLPDDVFGEGITVLKDKVYQLTYKDKKSFIYDKETLAQLGSFNWNLEGWGITTDGAHFIISNGSSYLFFVDTATFNVVRRLQVADDKKLINRINELEYVDGALWANVWQTDDILEIDPQSGKVLRKLNLRGILSGYEANKDRDDVLNGIAYNPANKSFYVTGKKWPSLFEITLSTGELTSITQ